MTRFINILLIVTITMLAMQLFFAPKPGPTVGSGGLLITSTKSEYAVPNMPIVHLYGSGAIEACSDLSIARNGAVMTGLPQAFCDQKITLSVSGTLLDMKALAPLFREPAKYSIVSKKEGTQASVEFTIGEKGFFNAFFSAVAYAPVYNLFALVAHHITGESFFWAIIIVTIIIRLLLLYPQHKVLVNSRRLQAIQPQMQELQTKHKGDQVTLWQAVLELYKSEKVNPLSSITPLLFQMPILIVLYWIILDVKNPVNEYYLYPFLGEFNPTLLNTSAFGISLDERGGLHALVLCVAIGLAQLVQVQLSYRGIEVKKKVDTAVKEPSDMPTIDPEFMRLMMMYAMPLVMSVTTYFFPLGVGIYWFIGTLFMLVQQIVVNAYTRISSPKTSKAVIDVQ